MSYIVFSATLICLWVLSTRGLEKAFLWVWIPFFLGMPFKFWVNIPGLPDPNFMQAAILPILFVLLRDKLDQLHFGRMEFLLAIYVIWRVFCDFLGRGYSDAQNYAFFMLSALIGPYLLGRYVITSRRMDIETSRMFVLMFLIFFPMFIYEIKMWVSPIYKMFSPFFPGTFSAISVRWGMARTFGTFEHPILACVIIIAVYRLHRWLCWVGAWDQPQTGLLGWIEKQGKRLPFAFKHQISIVLILMAAMTMSRGPWIGGFTGAALVMVGNMKNRRKWLVILCFGFLVGGLGGKALLDAYITPAEGEKLSEEAHTMLYRKVMLEKYDGYLEQKLWTGWGLTTVPKVKGMESVDNAFFLMALQHGVIAPTIFAMIFFYAIVSQLKYGLKARPGESPISFSFAGVYLVCLVAFTTVYMGSQTEPLIFLLLGWGESIKRRQERVVSPAGAAQPLELRRQPFQRLLT